MNLVYLYSFNNLQTKALYSTSKISVPWQFLLNSFLLEKFKYSMFHKTYFKNNISKSWNYLFPLHMPTVKEKTTFIPRDIDLFKISFLST